MNSDPKQRTPLIDLTTIYGVESIFRAKTRDPWALQLAGKLADFVIYADIARYALPVKDSSQSEDDVTLPSLLLGLRSDECELFKSEVLLTDQCGEYNTKFLPSAVKPFHDWAISNMGNLKRWIKLHNEKWIREPHGERLPRRYAIPVSALKSEKELDLIAKKLSEPVEEIWYALDVILRYPVYGDLTGKGNGYLNHPIRDIFDLPTMERKPATATGAVSFRDCVASFAKTLTQDEYIKLLLKLRNSVRNKGLHLVSPGQFEVETIRKIAREAGIPATLIESARLIALAGGIAGGVAAIPTIGIEATIVGGIISVAGALWPGKIPRSISKVSWLKWAFEWKELEVQADKRN